MAANFYTLEESVRKAIKAADLELFDLQGQVTFPIYAQSGGVYSKFISYAKPRSLPWPENCDLGREGECPKGIIAIEVEIGWSDEQVNSYILEVISRG